MITEESLLAALGPELPPLAFILGAHRSGTTFLHQVLSETGHYSYVRPYDLVHFDHLLQWEADGSGPARRALLDGELRAGQADRGLDELGVGAEVAEEYGHILPKEGRFSLFNPSLTAANRPRFELFCRKKRGLDGATRPLILKNPDDFYTNFVQLHAWYPEARMVFLHRHPLAALNSRVRAWTRLLETPNPYFARINAYYRHLLTDPKEMRIARQVLASRAGARGELNKLSQAYTYYLDHVAHLPAALRLVLRYEDLCADPDSHFRDISRFLGQPAPLESLRSRINTRPVCLLPQVEAAYEAGSDSLAAYLAEFAYPRHPEF